MLKSARQGEIRTEHGISQFINPKTKEPFTAELTDD
jgi:hypothetical protein